MEYTRFLKEDILIYAFMAGNVFYGLGFALLGNWSGVNSSSLFKSMYEVETWLPTIWGTVLVAAVVLCVLSLRSRLGTGVGSVLGIGCWLYATLVYLLTGYWLVVFSVGFLYLTFWVYYHFKFIYSRP